MYVLVDSVDIANIAVIFRYTRDNQSFSAFSLKSVISAFAGSNDFDAVRNSLQSQISI